MYIITLGVTIKTNKQKYKEIYPNTQQNSKKSSDNSEGKKEGNEKKKRDKWTMNDNMVDVNCIKPAIT